MNNFPKGSTSDDEDDLELLRLKALETLKRKNAAADSSINIPAKSSCLENSNQFGRNKRRRIFGTHLGRGGKNFQANFNRVRNTNLISITPVSDGNNVDNQRTPLSKYSEKQNNVEEGTSKFSRYDNSDKSDTESEEEEEVSESVDASPGKLDRTDSLEALMQELDNEIQGKPKAKEEKQANGDKDKVKMKKIKKKKRLMSDSDQKITESKIDNEQSEKSVEVTEPNVKDSESKEPITNENRNTLDDKTETPLLKQEFDPRKRQRSRSPFNRRTNFRARRPQPYSNPRQPLHPAMGHSINQFHPQMLPMYTNPHYNQIYPPPVGSLMSQPPPFYERPISPLTINTESLTTATLAPLSPRSAAFVLQNKAIIEKRKRSPRRSYSRSFSRSLSRSPRRSLTPPRRLQRRSISPRRLSRSPRRFSPRRRSLSPKKKSLSPRRRNAANKDGSPRNNHPVRNRLGNKSGVVEDANKEKGKGKSTSPAKADTSLNPVLEARKKKFESFQLGKKAGIIRLKPKEEKLLEATELSSPKKEDTSTKVSTENAKAVPANETDKDPDEFKELEELLNEDKLLESGDDFIDHKVEDIFSDEESNSDNEGRFKVKEKSGEKVPVLSFSKLLNGVEGVKSESLQTGDDKFRGRHNNSRYNERRRRSPLERRAPFRRDLGRDRNDIGREKKDTARERKEVRREKKVDREIKNEDMEQGVEGEKKLESQEKSPVKQRISLKKERPPPTIEKRFERKIEIKIKNPSKYEKISKEKILKGSERVVKTDKVIEIENENEGVVELKDEVSPESVEEVNDEELTVNDGDLRAQLSRKRAEKSHKVPIEEVSSRILQFALQGAVYKKTKKKSKDKNITESDGKLPIHLRLGLGNQTEIFEDVKVKRKSRKRKSREVLDQV